jgi:putative ABC transport system permease protein
VVAAIVLATPVVLKGMDSWLSSYAFRIDLRWQVILMAGLAAMALALVTVGGQALRAANLDPVKTLRSE